MAIIKKESMTDVAPGVPKFLRKTRVTHDGFFRIGLPEKVYKFLGDLPDVIGLSLKDALEEWEKKVEEYSVMNSKYETIIAYTTEKIRDYSDGRGVGVKLFWAVFRKATVRGRSRYHKISGMESHSAYLKDEEVHKLNQMKHTAERELWFAELERKITALRDNLLEFMKQSNLDDLIDANNIPTLGPGQNHLS